MNRTDGWHALPLRTRAQIIRRAVSEGTCDLNAIRSDYGRFLGEGDMQRQTPQVQQNLPADNEPHRPDGGIDWLARIRTGRTAANLYGDGGRLASTGRRSAAKSAGGSRHETEGGFDPFGSGYPMQPLYSPRTQESKEKAYEGYPDDPLMMKIRQRFMESGFNDYIHPSGKGAVGRYQIRKPALDDYVAATGIRGDLTDPAYNEDVRDRTMDWLYGTTTVSNGNPSGIVMDAKAYAAYNMGIGSLGKYLTGQKEKGVDIYNSLDWVEGLPAETRNYVKFIVLGEDVNGHKNRDMLLQEAARYGVELPEEGREY